MQEIEEKEEKKQDKDKAKNKMVEIKPNISVAIINYV